MSTARRLALVVTAASVLVVLNAAAAHAQAGPSNPSGGTSLRQTTLEGWGSFSPAGLFSRAMFQTGWQSWFGPSAAARSVASVVGWTSDWRSPSAIVRRPVARR